MADQITNVPAPGGDSHFGMGMIIGVVVVILVIIGLFILFGRGYTNPPAAPESGGGVDFPSQIDVNVNTPAGQ